MINDSCYNDILILKVSNPAYYVVDGSECSAIAIIDDEIIEPLEKIASGYYRFSDGHVESVSDLTVEDREKAYEYFRLAAEQGNVYAAYFLEHWNDMPHPDLLLMATRLMHHLEKIIEDDVSGKKGGRRTGMDRKLARKIRQKKIAQGHARDDREEMVQTQ